MTVGMIVETTDADLEVQEEIVARVPQETIAAKVEVIVVTKDPRPSEEEAIAIAATITDVTHRIADVVQAVAHAETTKVITLLALKVETPRAIVTRKAARLQLSDKTDFVCD
jgi:hypothetical protein